MAEQFHHIPFEPLLDELAAQGFYFGVDSHLRLNRWLALQAARKETGSVEKLKFSLAALLCQSDEQFQIFIETFDRLYVEAQAELPPVPGLKPMENGGLEPLPEEAVEMPELPVTTPIELPKVASSRRGPIRIELDFPSNPLRVWNLERMDQAVQPLREKEWTDTLDWDIPASIRQTIRAGGIPQFIFKKRKQAPSYLVLIEELGPRDHLARFYRELVLEMNRRDIDAEYFFYERSPHFCWKDRTDARSRTPIERLLAEHPGTRLLLVGRSKGLLQLPRLYPSNLALMLREEWSWVALLSTDSPSGWGLGEMALSQVFPVVPATAEGLAALLPQWETAKVLTPYYWQLEAPEPVTPEPRVRRRRVEPETITGLQRYLGPGGFRWLCATAYYPELYYELTSLLNDEVIPPEANLSEWEQNYRWWVALGRICRLPWFRKGKLPEVLREELRPLLPEAGAREVRRQLLEVLQLPGNEPLEGSYAEASRTFTLAWLEAEQTGQSIESLLPTDQEILLSDIEDAIGRKIWLGQQQAAAQEEQEQMQQTENFNPQQSNVYNQEQEQTRQTQPDLRLQGFISLVKKAKNFREAIEYFDQMKGEDVQPNLEFFNEMMAKATNPEESYAVLSRMKSEGVRPNEATFRGRIVQAKGLDDAMKIFEEMRGEGVQATNYIAGPLLEKAKTFEEARSVFNHLREAGGVRPNLETYTVLLKKTWKFDDARSVFEEMRSAGIQPDKIAYTVYLAKAPTYEDARFIFDEMKRERVETDPVTYTTLLDKTYDFQQARSTFEEMLKDGIKPNRGMYTQVMKRARQDEEADWVEVQMRKAGIGDGTIRRVRGQFDEIKKEEEQSQQAQQAGNAPVEESALGSPDFDQIRKLIADDQLREALDLLKEIAPDNNDVILQQARFNQTERDNNKGLLSSSDYARNLNQVRYAVLNMVHPSGAQ